MKRRCFILPRGMVNWELLNRLSRRAPIRTLPRPGENVIVLPLAVPADVCLKKMPIEPVVSTSI